MCLIALACTAVGVCVERLTRAVRFATANYRLGLRVAIVYQFIGMIFAYHHDGTMSHMMISQE